MKIERKQKSREKTSTPRYGGLTYGVGGPKIPVGADVVTIERSGLCARFFFVLPPEGEAKNLGVETCVSQ